jgi:hypothetical protein
MMVTLDERGLPVDTIARFSIENRTWQIPFGRGGSQIGPQPFSDAELVRVSAYVPEVIRLERTAAPGPDRAASFTVSRLSYAGDTLWSRSFDYASSRISERAIQAEIDEFTANWDRVIIPGSPPLPQAREYARANLYTPAAAPPIRDVHAGADGSIWLQTLSVARENQQWLLIRPGGERVGMVTLPSRFTILAARADSVWGMLLDELDVPYLVRFDVQWPR